MSTLETILAQALRGEGLTDDPANYDDGIHSWRCSHPDIYGTCTCFADMVTDVADAIREWLTNADAIERAARSAATEDGFDPDDEWAYFTDIARAAITAALTNQEQPNG